MPVHVACSAPVDHLHRIMLLRHVRVEEVVRFEHRHLTAYISVTTATTCNNRTSVLYLTEVQECVFVLRVRVQPPLWVNLARIGDHVFVVREAADMDHKQAGEGIAVNAGMTLSGVLNIRCAGLAVNIHESFA